MSEKAPKPKEVRDVNQAFDPEHRQAQNEWDAYLSGRPTQLSNGTAKNPDNGQFISPDKYFDGVRADAFTDTQETDYEDLGPSDLARMLGEAQAHGDKTTAIHIEEVLTNKIVEKIESTKDANDPNSKGWDNDEAKGTEDDMVNAYLDHLQKIQDDAAEAESLRIHGGEDEAGSSEEASESLSETENAAAEDSAKAPVLPQPPERRGDQSREDNSSSNQFATVPPAPELAPSEAEEVPDVDPLPQPPARPEREDGQKGETDSDDSERPDDDGSEKDNSDKDDVGGDKSGEDGNGDEETAPTNQERAEQEKLDALTKKLETARDKYAQLLAESTTTLGDKNNQDRIKAKKAYERAINRMSAFNARQLANGKINPNQLNILSTDHDSEPQENGLTAEQNQILADIEANGGLTIDQLQKIAGVTAISELRTLESKKYEHAEKIAANGPKSKFLKFWSTSGSMKILGVEIKSKKAKAALKVGAGLLAGAAIGTGVGFVAGLAGAAGGGLLATRVTRGVMGAGNFAARSKAKNYNEAAIRSKEDAESTGSIVSEQLHKGEGIAEDGSFDAKLITSNTENTAEARRKDNRRKMVGSVALGFGAGVAAGEAFDYGTEKIGDFLFGDGFAGGGRAAAEAAGSDVAAVAPEAPIDTPTPEAPIDTPTPEAPIDTPTPEAPIPDFLEVAGGKGFEDTFQSTFDLTDAEALQVFQYPGLREALEGSQTYLEGADLRILHSGNFNLNPNAQQLLSDALRSVGK